MINRTKEIKEYFFSLQFIGQSALIGKFYQMFKKHFILIPRELQESWETTHRKATQFSS